MHVHSIHNSLYVENGMVDGVPNPMVRNNSCSQPCTHPLDATQPLSTSSQDMALIFIRLLEYHNMCMVPMHANVWAAGSLKEWYVYLP